MRRLALAILLLSSTAHADATQLSTIPLATSATTLDMQTMGTRPSAPWQDQCVLATTSNHGIHLQWLSERSIVRRTAFAMFRKNEKGDLEIDDPRWAYEPVVRVESVTDVPAMKIAERGTTAVWAYREANAVVAFVPGRSGSTAITGSSGGSCPMAMAVLSTKPEAECKTTAGCARLARIVLNGSDPPASITLGVSEDRLAVMLKN
jgi:hypothetical protein